MTSTRLTDQQLAFIDTFGFLSFRGLLADCIRQITDWQIAPRAFTITNGMTMALPPEYVDRVLMGQNGYVAADFDFQARLLLFVRPTVGFLYPLGGSANPAQLARGKHMVDLYRHFVRPFMSQGRIYHHTPTFDTEEPQGWAC
jgi:alpha-galactosidase